MKKYFMLIFLTGYFVTGYTQPDKVGNSIIELSKKKFQWMINQRLDSLGELFDSKLKFIHSNGWIQTPEQLLADFKSGKLAYTSISVDQAECRLYGKTAIVTGTGHFEGLLNSSPFAMNLCYTEVYVETSGKWLMVSRHANRLP
jgi:Domain of unknown function (DUF4440)